MRRLIVPTLILLLALWPSLAPSPAAAEEAAPYHPEFNGLNLLATFPELAKRHRRGERIDVSGVYEHEDGRIVVRLTSFYFHKKGIDAWHLDLFARTLTPVPLKVGAPPGPGWRQLEMDRDRVGALDGGLFFDPIKHDPDCEGQLLSYLTGGNVDSNNALFFLQKFPNIFVGGDGCSPSLPLKKFQVGLRSGASFVLLPDHTLLVWPFWQTTDLIRVNRDLSTSYRSPNVLLLTKPEWLSALDIPDEDYFSLVSSLAGNPIEKQKTLLRRFDQYLQSFKKRED